MTVDCRSVTARGAATLLLRNQYSADTRPTVSTRILLADDHEIFRDGLRSLLEQQPGLTVVAEVEDGLQAVAAVREHTPDVAVMDLSMPGMNGIEATRRIVETVPSVNVLCLSVHTDSEFVLAVLDAGASGYVVKDCAREELLRALGVVMEGKTYLSPSIAGLVVEAHRADRVAAVPLLTTREREVLQGIAEGLTTHEIAARLYISEKTVGTHRRHLMDKLDIDTVAGLIKYAIRKGLTSADE